MSIFRTPGTGLRKREEVIMGNKKKQGAVSNRIERAQVRIKRSSVADQCPNEGLL
jgi:hypothetical protein